MWRTSTKVVMSARDTLRRNKTAIQSALCADYRLILNMVYERKLITQREYRNLKDINKETVEGHVIELLDKIMPKGEQVCQDFLQLLQTDLEIEMTYPELKNILGKDGRFSPNSVQECSIGEPAAKRQKREETQLDQYQLNNNPVGLCLIINNEYFTKAKVRGGTNKDCQSLAEVFSWLRFRVLMCKDRTQDQMKRTLSSFVSHGELSQLQELDVKEWTGSKFEALQQAPAHGDAFVCCILSHGERGAVLGTDGEPVSIKHITRTFRATKESPLTGKPKVFLIQACQGAEIQRGVLSNDLEADGAYEMDGVYQPEEADVLVAVSTVEGYASIRHTENGSWFIQSVCKQLKEGCERHEDLLAILRRVNDEVSQKESLTSTGAVKQMSEVHFTLRKALHLSPDIE